MPRAMTERRWLALLAIAGLAIFGLSFVNAWILHERELRGEGYRFVTYLLSAWRGVGMPVLTLGVLAALATGVAALLRLLGTVRMPGWLLLVGSTLALGLVASAAWPVSQSGHASDVSLSAALLLPVGVVLALAMVWAAAALTRPDRRLAFVLAAGAVVVFAGGSAGRWLGLQLAEGTGRHWSEGSYTRQATGGEPTETLTISGERVAIGDRWAGSWEWSGWTVVIDDDPACPDARGTYHAHDAGGESLRFVKVVDPCQDGARATDLETGIWERVP